MIRLFPKKLWKLLMLAGDGWIAHEAPTMAASLSYFAIFSIAPLLVIILAIAGFVFDQTYVQELLLGSLRGVVGEETTLLIHNLLKVQLNPLSSLQAFLFGLATLLLGATGIVNQLQAILNKVWEIPASEWGGMKNYMKSKILAVVLVFVLALLIMFSIFINIALAYVTTSITDYIPWYTRLLPFVDTIAIITFLTLFFTIVFAYLPYRKIAMQKVFRGAFATAILVYMGKYLISIYLSFSTASSAFGAASAVVVMLVWIYMMSLLVLFGAEVTRILETRKKR